MIGIVSLAALYRAFAIGPIAVVSPVVASYAALTVILIVIFLGERLTTGQSIAIGVTFVGVAVASTDIRELRKTLGRPTEGVRIGFFATLGFAVWSAIFAVGVRETDGLALIVVQRAFSVVLLALFVIARGISLRPLAERRALALVAVTGVLDTGANVLLALGIALGYRVVRHDRERRVSADPRAARDPRPTRAPRAESVRRCGGACRGTCRAGPAELGRQA